MEEISDYIGQGNQKAAIRFLEAAEKAFEEIAAIPRIGHAYQSNHPNLSNILMWPIPRFERYLLFYCPIENGVEIIRVIHSARDIPAIMEEEQQEH